MRILILACPPEQRWISSSIDYPLGIAYLHSALEETGHKVESRFSWLKNKEEFHDEIDQVIADFKPHIIGIQVYSTNRVNSYREIEFLSEHHGDIQIVIGGVHTSTNHLQIIDKYPSVIAVLGEGERTIQDLATTLENGGAPSAVNGIAYHDGTRAIKTEARALIADLDELPFPKHEAFLDASMENANILTSRGCPFSCSFCVLDVMSEGKVRFRSAKNIVDEIEYILRIAPQLKTIWIHDDQFLASNKRVIEICDEIVQRGIKLEFMCSGRVKPISRKVILAMERAGFTMMLFGLESGSEDILGRAYKGITQKDFLNAMKLLGDSRIRATAFLIVGLPGETDETIQETCDFVKKAQTVKYLHYPAIITTLLLYPGTEVYRQAVKGDMELPDGTILTDDYWLGDGNVPEYIGEKNASSLIKYRDKLFNNLSLSLVFTKPGLEAQKETLSAAITHAFWYKDYSFTTYYTDESGKHLQLAVINTLQRLTDTQKIRFMFGSRITKAVETEGHFRVLLVEREPGSEHRYIAEYVDVMAEEIGAMISYTIYVFNFLAHTAPQEKEITIIPGPKAEKALQVHGYLEAFAINNIFESEIVSIDYVPIPRGDLNTHLRQAMCSEALPYLIEIIESSLTTQLAMEFDENLELDVHRRYMGGHKIGKLLSTPMVLSTCNEAINLYNNQQVDKAIDILNLVLEYDPDQPFGLSTMGSCMFVKTEYPAARDYFEKALAIDPSNTAALKGMEIVRNAMKQTD